MVKFCRNGIDFRFYFTKYFSIPQSTCPVKVSQKPTDFLHHNQIRDAESPWTIGPLHWTCGQGKYDNDDDAYQTAFAVL